MSGQLDVLPALEPHPKKLTLLPSWGPFCSGGYFNKPVVIELAKLFYQNIYF